MSKDNLIPDNLFEWMQQERKTNFSYWKDRASNGSGLIKEIADFVIESGEAR